MASILHHVWYVPRQLSNRRHNVGQLRLGPNIEFHLTSTTVRGQQLQRHA